SRRIQPRTLGDTNRSRIRIRRIGRQIGIRLEYWRGEVVQKKQTARDALVADVQRRGDESANVHYRSAAKQDAVRVDQIDLPDAFQRSIDGRGPRIEDSIQCHPRGVALRELDGVAGGDVEALPVVDGARCTLLDLQLMQ